MEGRGLTKEEIACVSRDAFLADGYFERTQLVSFTEQIRLIFNTRKRNILEIGKGNGFVSYFLKNAEYDVTTIDVNKNLNPDVVGSVLDLAAIFGETRFQLVHCAEVLEHIPFEYFEIAIDNIVQVSSDYVTLTLPRAQRILLDFQFSAKLPKFRRMESGIFLSIPSRYIGEGHYWEIDAEKRTRLSEIRKFLHKHFSIEKSGRFRFHPYHYYFVLRKR